MLRKHYLVDQTAPFSDKALNPRLIGTGCIKGSSWAWANRDHEHQFCEMVYICDGYGQALVNGVHYRLRKGDLLIYNPGLVHREWADTGKTLHLLYGAFDSFQLDGNRENFLLDEAQSPMVHTARQRKKIETLLQQLVEETSAKDYYYFVMSNAVLTALIATVLREIHSQADSNQEQVADCCAGVKNYLNEHFGESITLEGLAETFFISAGHLSHVFKEQTGISPIKYLITRRMEEASGLLLNTDLPIKEISAMVGYDSPVSFSQTFKKVVGVSPNSYRRQL